MYWNVMRPNGEWLCTTSNEREAFDLAYLLNSFRHIRGSFATYYVKHSLGAWNMP